MNFSRYIKLLLFLAAALLLTCRDTPRNNPFDPEGEVLIVEVVSPPAGRSYTTGHPIIFEVAARTGFDNQPAGSRYLWKSDISGVLSEQRKFAASLPPGVHRIQVTVSDSLGRKGVSSFALTVRSADQFGVEMVVPAADTAFIVGTSFEPLAAEYIPDGYSIIGRLWEFGAGSGIPQSTQTEPGLVTYAQTGTFPLIYQVVDQQGRVAADTVMVEVVESGNPPVAQIYSPESDTTLSVGDSIYLEAVALQTAGRIVYKSWIYPVGSGLENRQDTLDVPGWVMLHNPGVFPLRFVVSDLLGNIAADTVTLTVNDTLPPPVGSIAAPAGDTAVVAGDSIYFRGQVAPAGIPKLNNLWTWGAGSGIAADTVMEPGWITFDSSGTFTVVYTALDRSGRGAPDSLTVTVAANQPPVASIVSPSGDISIGLGVTLNFAGNDSDPEGRTLVRFWLWDSTSGITPSSADSAQAAGTRAFNTNGTFLVRYVVVDDKGLVAADSVTVSVSDNQPPSAQITAPSADTTVYAWAPITFVGTDSDADGTVASRQWDFGEPGLSAAGDTSRTPAAVAFTTAGSYGVVYTVTDNKLTTGADTLAVTVNANEQPMAMINSPAGNISISAGDSLSFVGLDFDLDGSVTLRVWTYGTGSGLPPDSTSIPDYRTFPNQGTFIVEYRVTDNHGGVAADSLLITVGP